VSDILHPYLHAELSANAIVDMLTAGITFCNMNNIELNKDLYIGGYSEGGFTTLAAQKAIEEDNDFPFSLQASAPAAGPYDLYNTTTYFIDLDEYPEPAFMAYLFTAYNDVYRWNRLDNFFNAPYAEMMPNLFDGTKTTTEISDALPVKVSELFTADFITGFRNGTEKEVIDALKENTLLNWTPTIPMRFYHSNTDEIVPYQNSVTAVETFRDNGATDIKLITLDSLQHSEGGVPAYTDMIEWFYSLKNN
jgi:predicted peptidase